MGNWTEKRIDRLENRLDERISNLEGRQGKRIDGIYSTLLWVMLLIFAAFYVAAVVGAASQG